VTETRRQALRMLGAVGATCAFPFAGDELYGQHVHLTTAQTPAPGPYAPAFFTRTEYETLASLCDTIIPATDTPGAAGAGVPEYIDRVVTANKEHHALMRAGLAWLERQAATKYSLPFARLGESERAALLQPLSDRIDRERRDALGRRFRRDAQGKDVFFAAITDRDVQARPAAPASPVAHDDPELPVRFFRLVKNLTADGYYTSRIGLLDELGYQGNRALARFPACTVREQ
jgi:hypothetical protein